MAFGPLRAAALGMAILLLGNVGVASSQTELPEWVRSVFGLWADGLVSDSELIAGLEFLISSGVIQASVADQIAGLERQVEEPLNQETVRD